ncbi:hypothetical protein CEE39_04485 [bacterium (candidate division B38) B3_B38]|nr:MAG: hypothetical protein CEE39_04485 [bacterium (candidate division B38) B3_B38]
MEDIRMSFSRWKPPLWNAVPVSNRAISPPAPPQQRQIPARDTGVAPMKRYAAANGIFLAR